MHAKLKSDIQAAINRAIQKNCENNMWQHWISDDLADRMADAAEAVFDASMSGQQFMKEQD